jgi:hypothetical protein
VLSRQASDRLNVAMGFVATLVQILFWRSLAGWTYWPSHDSSTLTLTGAAIFVGLVGTLARTKFRCQETEAQASRLPRAVVGEVRPNEGMNELDKSSEVESRTFP